MLLRASLSLSSSRLGSLSHNRTHHGAGMCVARAARESHRLIRAVARFAGYHGTGRSSLSGSGFVPAMGRAVGCEHVLFDVARPQARPVLCMNMSLSRGVARVALGSP